MNTRVFTVTSITTSLLLGAIVGYWVGVNGGSDNPNDANVIENEDGTSASVSPSVEAEANAINPVPTAAAQSAKIVSAASTADSATMPLLFEQASQITDAGTRLETMFSLYQRFAELAPAAAFDHAITHGAAHDSPWTDSWLNVIAYRWAQSDPEGALEMCRTMPAFGSRVAVAVLSALPVSTRGDVTRRMGWNPDLTQGTADVIASIADDPERAFYALEHLPLTRNGKFAAASTWVMRDPVEAFSVLTTLPDNEISPHQLSALMSAWATQEPDEAMAWLSMQADSDQKEKLIGAALAGWGTTDPETAIVAALELPDESQRTFVIGAVLANWTRQDPNGAIDWFNTLSGSERFRAVRSVSYSFVQVAPESAFHWAMTLSGDEQAMILPRIISSIGRENPENAMALAESISDEKMKSVAILPAMMEWARQEPDDALSYALGKNELNLQGRLVREVLRGMRYGGNSAQTGEVLAQIEGKSYFDQVAADSILSLQNIDDSIALLGKITETDAHQKAAKSVYVRLRNSDPPRAEAFRVQQGLPPPD